MWLSSTVVKAVVAVVVLVVTCCWMYAPMDTTLFATVCTIATLASTSSSSSTTTNVTTISHHHHHAAPDPLPLSKHQKHHRRLGEQQALLLSSSIATNGTTTTRDTFLQNELDTHLPLFEVSNEIRVIGPNKFPKPSYIFYSQGIISTPDGSRTVSVQPDDEVDVYIKPVSGTHRPEHDAVFIFAAEYPLQNYILFLSTLRLEAKFEGDIVMAISPMDWSKPEIRDYLQYGHPNVVVYIVKYSCYNAEGEDVDSSKGGARVCLCHDLFGKRKRRTTTSTTTTTTVQGDDMTSTGITSNDDVVPLPDPRHPRTVQNSRYELYWIWSTMYDPTSWIMLIDARDTIFVSDPFATVPRRRRRPKRVSHSGSGALDHDTDDNDTTTGGTTGGMLLLFGENVDATRLGKSKFNSKWLTNAYGDDVFTALKDKPTICSGSTMGEQEAVEEYLRAMVGESDETQTVLTGSDQGFHNYLYYSSKLSNSVAIREIIVQDQGYGIINNLGALRTKELNEWGNGKLYDVEKDDSGTVIAHTIRNYNGVLSPVVHQYDRHQVLYTWWAKTKIREYRKQWDEKRTSRKEE